MYTCRRRAQYSTRRRCVVRRWCWNLGRRWPDRRDHDVLWTERGVDGPTCSTAVACPIQTITIVLVQTSSSSSSSIIHFRQLLAISGTVCHAPIPRHQCSLNFAETNQNCPPFLNHIFLFLVLYIIQHAQCFSSPLRHPHWKQTLDYICAVTMQSKINVYLILSHQFHLPLPPL